jgi:hypothetical protein
MKKITELQLLPLQASAGFFIASLEHTDPARHVATFFSVNEEVTTRAPGDM